MRNALPRFTLAFIALILLTSFSAASYAENAKKLVNQLQSEKQKAANKKKKLTTLIKKEKRLKQTVSKEEKRIKELSRTIARQEKEYLEISSKNKTFNTKYNQLLGQHKIVQKELIALVKNLWPLYINTRTYGDGTPSDWDELDRRYTWASRLYSSVESKQRVLDEQKAQLASLLNRQKKLSVEAQKKLAAVNRTKDDLLRQRLNHRKQLKKVHAQKESAEASLRNVLSLIQNLHYKIEKQNESGAKFSLLKGVLPWPASGVIAKRFAPKRKPPIRGVGLALEDGSTVKAVSGGKVVHNDVLRGFGRVVILMHGEEFYTLYAFLADSKLQVGDSVKPKQVLGKAGFYPAVDGTGVYFELRFHQKAINPETWLSALD